MRKDARDLSEATQLQAIELIIQSVEDALQANVRSAFETCFNILDILRLVDFREFESMEPEDAVAAMEFGIAMQVLGSMEDSAKLLGRWTECVMGGAEAGFSEPTSQDQPNTDTEGRELDDSAPRAIAGIVQPKRDRFCEDLDRYVARAMNTTSEQAVEMGEKPVSIEELCHNLTLELLASRERLQAMCAERSKWGIITEGEEGRRKCQKILRAVFIVGCRELAPVTATELFPKDPSELETALFVREALMSFRASVRALAKDFDEVPEPEVEDLAQKALAHIETLLANDVYHMIRALDRFCLQDLRARLHTWLGSDREVTREGRWALQATKDFADILANVNRRELLIEHDRAIRNRVLGMVDGLSEYASSGNEEAVLPQVELVMLDLKKMAWRSAELDHLVERLTTVEAASSVAARLKELRTVLVDVRI
ncbi:MAG: hypothetical protein VX834_07140 [Myxococcota bacterium]|nr:hypothetical protein [Myxococcota bacterium]